MRKSFYLLGMAVAALSSCSQSDVVEMPDSAAIKFNSFVNKNTRSVTEVTTLSNFYVFGNYGATGSSTFDQTAFNNEPSTATHYWVANQDYRFGAYADGDATQIPSTSEEGGATVSFMTSKGGAGTLMFNNYVPDGKDLVAAVATHSTDGTVTDETKVELNFKHLLSQVRFTFKTTDADAYTLKISDLKIDKAISKANGEFGGSTTWTAVESNGLTYDDIADIAVAPDYNGSSVEMVIPQDKTNDLKVTFTATVSGAGLAEKSSTFEANLTYTPDAEDPKGETNKWTPGFRYNYIATINASQIDPNLENQKIEFETKIDPWEDADDTDNGELTGTPVEP